MAEDTTTKKILIDVQLKSDQITKELPALAGEIARLTASQAALRKESKQGTAEFVQQAQDLRELSGQYREANKYIDNVNKARNAENNSIQQNRALLSALTQDYVKLGQEIGKADPKTQQLGKSINDLTEKLKAQEKQIGQTYRNVGNYADSLTASLPIIGKYSGAITEAATAFNLMGNSAKEGGETAVVAVEEMGAVMSVVTFAVAALSAGVTKYFSQFAEYADGFNAGWERLKGNLESITNTIANGDFKNFFSNWKNAGLDANYAANSIANLSREMQNASTLTKEEDAQIALILLKIRNKGTDAVASEKLYQDALDITNKQYKRNSELAREAYVATVLAQTSGYNLTKEQLQGLTDLSKGYDDVLFKAKELVETNRVKKDFLEKINPALQGMIDVDAKELRKDQMLKNRNDAKAAKDKAKKDKELKEQEAYDAKQLKIQQKITQETLQSDSERIASYQRMLNFKQEAFGRELSTTTEHYRQLIFKQEEFIHRQENIANNPRNSAKTRGMAGRAIRTGRADISQLTEERSAATLKLIQDHHKAVVAETQKAANDLSQFQIQSLEDEEYRNVAANELDYKEKKEALNKQIDLINENKDKLAEQFKTAKVGERAALKEEYNKEQALLEDAISKRTETDLQYKQKGIDITKKFADKKASIEDQINILNAAGKKGLSGGKDNPFNSDLQSAKQKALLDNYNAEVSQKGLTEEAKLLIEKEYLQKSKELREQNEHDKRDMIVNGAQQVASAGLTIISNAIKSEQQAREVKLGREKDRELSNTSLTSAQKLAIENKYRILEGQAKIKAFRAEQKLALAKGAIDTAASIIKASPNPILIALAAATGALELGVIASQKPPAFAKGGTFRSDGKGSVLPGYSRRDNVNAQLRSGEAVIVSEAVRDPYARSILSGINQAFGGRSFGETNPGRGYAIGGIVTDGNNSNRYYAQPQLGTENLANTIAYSLINNFPPIITQVRDINNQQGILAKTTNRVDI